MLKYIHFLKVFWTKLMEDASVIKQMLTMIGFESCIMKSIIHLSTDTGTKKTFVKILTKGECFYTMRSFK